MEKKRLNSDKAFKLSCVVLFVIVLSIGVLVFSNIKKVDLPAIFIGGGFSLAGILALVGLIYSLKGIGEPTTVKKVLALFLNGFVVLLFAVFLLGDLMSS